MPKLMFEQISERKRHNLAYACFLPPGLFALVNGIASLVPMSTGYAGGIGFLVLIPLALVSLGSIPVAFFHTFLFRRDLTLLTLSGLTIVMIVLGFSGILPPKISSFVFLSYGGVVLSLAAKWFLVDRSRIYPKQGEQ